MGNEHSKGEKGPQILALLRPERCFWWESVSFQRWKHSFVSECDEVQDNSVGRWGSTSIKTTGTYSGLLQQKNTSNFDKDYIQQSCQVQRDREGPQGSSSFCNLFSTHSSLSALYLLEATLCFHACGFTFFYACGFTFFFFFAQIEYYTYFWILNKLNGIEERIKVSHVCCE